MTDNIAFDKAVSTWVDSQRPADTPATINEILVLGCTVFGDIYVDRFLRFCIPSLLAPGNIEAVPKPIIVIHTDLAHADLIRNTLDRFQQRAMFDVRAIPAEVIDKATRADRFELVGAATAIQIDIARAAGAGFHMLVPDHVYAIGFFCNLMRLVSEGHQAIVGGAISADVDLIGPKLKFADGKVKPKELNAWAMDALHPQFRALIKNGQDDFPYSTLYLYVSEHKACIVSPHVAPLYLSHSIIMRTNLARGIAIDAQLPDLIGTDHYIPSPDDGVTYIEVSGPEKPHNTPNMRWTAWDYCVGFYRLTNYDRRWLAYLASPTWIAFPDDYRPPVEPLMTEEEIEAAVTGTYEILNEGYGDRVQIFDPTGILEPPYLGAMFFDPDNTVFYQARGLTVDSWRFVPPDDLVGTFWKVYDFFVGAPPDDPKDPMAYSRHLDANLVRETMELNGIAVLDFGGESWRTVDGTVVYLVKLQVNRFADTIMFAGFASAKPRPAQMPDGGTGFELKSGLLTFGDRGHTVLPGEFVGLRIEIRNGTAKAFLNDELFNETKGEATKYPVVAVFHYGDGPHPTVPGYDGAMNRAQNTEELP